MTPVVGPRFLAAMLAGAVSAALAFGLLLSVLQWRGTLPPPPIANVVCVDEKLLFLRAHQPLDPDFLVIGSSVAWRHFDGYTASRELPGARPLNGAFCHLNIAQTALATDWLLKRLPNVRDLVLIASPQDFESCPGAAGLFDLHDADRFVFQKAAPWRFYTRYFDPVSLVRNARLIRQQRTDRGMLNPIVFDEYGDGPMDTVLSHTTLAYGPVENLDSGCFTSLRALAVELRRTSKTFMVVTQPLHPAWKQQFDHDLRMQDMLDVGIRRAVEGTGALYWNALEEATFDGSAFTDAIHMRWSAARLFTSQIMRMRARATARREN